MKIKPRNPYREYILLCQFADALTDRHGANWISLIVSESLYDDIMRAEKKNRLMHCRPFPFQDGHDRTQIKTKLGRQYVIWPDREVPRQYGAITYGYRLSDAEMDEETRGGNAFIGNSKIVWEPAKTLSEVTPKKCVAS